MPAEAGGGHDTATLEAFWGEAGKVFGRSWPDRQSPWRFLPFDSPPRILAVERQTRHCPKPWCRRLGSHSRRSV